MKMKKYQIKLYFFGHLNYIHRLRTSLVLKNLAERYAKVKTQNFIALRQGFSSRWSQAVDGPPDFPDFPKFARLWEWISPSSKGVRS